MVCDLQFYKVRFKNILKRIEDVEKEFLINLRSKINLNNILEIFLN